MGLCILGANRSAAPARFDGAGAGAGPGADAEAEAEAAPEGVEAIPEEEDGEDEEGGEEKKAAAEGRLARPVEPVAVAVAEVDVDGPPLPDPVAALSLPAPLAALVALAARSAAAVSAASALAFSDVKLMPAKRDMASVASVKSGRMNVDVDRGEIQFQNPLSSLRSSTSGSSRSLFRSSTHSPTLTFTSIM